MAAVVNPKRGPVQLVDLEDLCFLGTVIYKDLIHDRPAALYYSGNDLREVISLQWVLFFLKTGQLERSDPPFWGGKDRWHREFIPTVIKALLPKDSTFLREAMPIQLTLVARIDLLLGELVRGNYTNRVQALNWDKLPPEVHDSLLEYMLRHDHLLGLSKKKYDRQLQIDANQMAETLYPFLRNLSAGEDSKEES